MVGLNSCSANIIPTMGNAKCFKQDGLNDVQCPTRLEKSPFDNLGRKKKKEKKKENHVYLYMKGEVEESKGENRAKETA